MAGGRTASPGELLEPAAAVDGMPFLDTVLGGGTYELEALPGGLTNRNYRVRGATGRSAVVRLAGPKTELLGIDRAAEVANSQLAADAGVGPAVLDHAPGVLVVDWIDGRTLTDADLDDPATLGRVAAACRQLHGGPRFVTDFDMVDTQRRYLDLVTTHGFRLPPRYLEHGARAAEIGRVLQATTIATAPCHNDLLAANILDDGARLWLIDYEYAGNNDPAFELGNIWSEAALPPDRLDHLVAAYAGGPSPVDVARARLWALLSKYGWMLWASIQDAVSRVDFDFWNWGLEKYDRAERDFADPQLERWIDTVRDAGRHRTEERHPWSTPPS